MILEEETFREFGYYPSDWAPKSHKKILATCDKCGKVRVVRKGDYRSLCKSCAQKGRIPWNKEIPHTEETKRKMRENQPDRSGEKNPMFGKHPSEETKKKLSEAHKGVYPSKETRQKMSESRRGENNPNYGKHRSEETKKKMSEASKKRWQDPDYIKKVFDGWKAKPNKQENNVGAILQKHMPNEYAYNGDFSCGITIGGKIPDFVNVNGEKVVIEVFGPWHDEAFMRERFGDDISWKRTEFGTKAFYSQFGYKCVVLWQEDLEREDVEQHVLSVLKKEGVI